MGIWAWLSMSSVLTSQLAPSSTSLASSSSMSPANVTVSWPFSSTTVGVDSLPTVNTTTSVVSIASTSSMVEALSTSVSATYESAVTVFWEMSVLPSFDPVPVSTSEGISTSSASSSPAALSAPTVISSEVRSSRVSRRRTTTTTTTYTPVISAPSALTPAPVEQSTDATATPTATVIVDFDCDNGVRYGTPTGPVQPVATASGAAIAVAVSNDPHDYRVDVGSGFFRICSVNAEGDDNLCAAYNMTAAQSNTSANLEARGMVSNRKRVGRALAKRECKDRGQELATALGVGLGAGLPGVAGAGWLLHKILEASRLSTLANTLQYKPLQVLEDGIPDLFRDILPPAPANPPVSVEPPVEPPAVPEPVPEVPSVPVEPVTPQPPAPADPAPVTPPVEPPVAPEPVPEIPSVPEEPVAPQPQAPAPPEPVTPPVDPPVNPEPPIVEPAAPIEPVAPPPPGPAPPAPPTPPVEPPVIPQPPTPDLPTPVKPVTPLPPAPPADPAPVKPPHDDLPPKSDPPHDGKHKGKHDGKHEDKDHGKDNGKDNVKDDPQNDDDKDHDKNNDDHQKDQSEQEPEPKDDVENKDKDNSDTDNDKDHDKDHDDHQKDQSEQEPEPKDDVENDIKHDSQHDVDKDHDKDHDDHQKDESEHESEPKDDVKRIPIDEIIHEAVQRNPHRLKISEAGDSSEGVEVKIDVEPEQIGKIVEERLSSHHGYVEDRLSKTVIDTVGTQLEKGAKHLDHAALNDAIRHEADQMVEETEQGFEAGVEGAYAGGAGQEEAIKQGEDEADEIVWRESAADVRARQMAQNLRDHQEVQAMMERVLERVHGEQPDGPGLPENGLNDHEDFRDQVNHPGSPEHDLSDLEDFAREMGQQQAESQNEADERSRALIEDYLKDLNSDAEFRARSRHGFNERAPSQASEIRASSPNALENLAHAPFMQHEARRSTEAINSLLEDKFGRSLSEAESDMLTEVQTQDLTSDALENTAATGPISSAEALGSLVEGGVRDAMSRDSSLDVPTRSVDEMILQTQSLLREAQQQLGLDYKAAAEAAIEEGATFDEVVSVARSTLQELKLADEQTRSAVEAVERSGRADRGKQYNLDVVNSVQDFSDVEPMERMMDQIKADLLGDSEIADAQIDDPNTNLRYRSQLWSSDTIEAAARDQLQRLRASESFIEEQISGPTIRLHGPGNALNAHDPAPTLGMSAADRVQYLKQTHAFWYEYPADFDYVEAMENLRREIDSRVSTTGTRVSDARLVHKLKGQLQQMDAYKSWSMDTNRDSRIYPPTQEQMHDLAQAYHAKFPTKFNSAVDAERYLTQPWKSSGPPPN